MQSRFRLFTFAVLLLLIKVCPVLSQHISFNKVSLPDETISDLITCITQDLQGNIWFASSGLHQFDGVHLKSYVHDPLNPGSLANNYVECVYTDKSGNIWAGTYGSGLEKFDPQTGAFTHYKHNEQDPASIGGDSVTCILQDHEGILWIGTIQHGLSRMDPKTGKFTHYKHKDNDPKSLSFDQVRVIYEDKEGTLWIGTGEPFFDGNRDKKGGLNRFNRSTGEFTRYLHDEKNPSSLIDDRVRAIFEDSYGNFWVGTAGDGLHTMDRAKGTFERHTYDPAHPEKLSRPPVITTYPYGDDHITFITEDAKRTLWIGTFENGVANYDPIEKKITHYKSEKDSVGNFSDSTTWSVFTSRDGVMWMSVFPPGQGFYRFDPSHQNIQHTDLNLRGGLFSFLEEPNNVQWFGTASGLLRVDSKNPKTQLFLNDAKKPGTISNDGVVVLYKDRRNRLWAGTNNGLNLFNPDKQNFTAYKHDPKISSSLINEVIFCLYEDEQSYLWIGDTTTGGKNFVTCLLEDTKHKLWVGAHSSGGLHVLDRKTGQFTNYLVDHSIVSICEDAYGKIWTGAEDGLYKYNSIVDSFSLFIDPSTGYSIVTHAMVEDNNKNLWILSPSGIYRINNRDEVSKFSKAFGINGLSLNYLSAHKANDGQLIFGNSNGYYSFYPDKISSNTKPPQIVLTDFRIGDQQVKPGSGSALQEDLLHAKQIVLSYDQDIFSILFNVIHYSNPDANKAMYMLENYDKGWRPASSEHTAYYYNIPPGKYTFHIKAASSYGVWAEKNISIIITPPWWRTWWTYCIYALLIITAVYTLHRIQKQRVINAERERTRERELAQAKEIEKAYNELKTTQTQLIQQEKMASLGELTAGIAHEIQNPLNFVNNFSEVNKELVGELREAKDNPAIRDEILNNLENNLEKIIHHGKRADAIVKGMLQHSRSSSNIKEPTDINALADEYLRLAYHGLRAKDKSFNVTLQTDFDESIGEINIVRQDIGRTLLNLYNNAFYAVMQNKNANENYAPTVSVSTKKVNGKVEIRVKDNGNGIPQKVLDKIFQPFFTTKPTGQGTRIRSIVKL